jgi:hypothetical protein
MAEVERGWFRDFVGDPAPPFYCSDEDLDADFDRGRRRRRRVGPGDLPPGGRRLPGAGSSPRPAGDPGRRTRPDHQPRWIIVHMIEEYARHNGHADLLRERIDGVVGD